MCAEKLTLDIKASILKHIAMLKPTFPRRAVISIGDYSSQILLKSTIIGKNEDLLTFFIQKTKEDLIKILALHTNKDIKTLEKDMDRDYFMSPTEAKNYGLVDAVIEVEKESVKKSRKT
jgi:hypothetical protein